MRKYSLFSLLLLSLLAWTACGDNTNGGGGGGTDTTAAIVPAPSLDLPFQIVVQPAANQPAGMPGLHSSAFGASNGQWLFVGGRTNGFHGFFGPDRVFPQTTANDKIWVIDQAAGKTYSWTLPTSWDLRDNLMANNMAYVQVGDILYFVGGYGSQSASGPSNYTFNTCIGINVPAMIAAVIAGDGTAAQAAVDFVLEDEALRVTGGEMETINGDLFLVFGQDYPRAYDGQNGTYTESIVQFRVNMEPAPALQIIQTYTYQGTGANQFHRRDLNAVHGMVNKQEAIIAWSGVFTDQQGAWPNPIIIAPNGSGISTTVDTGFTQKANLYKSAVVIQYDASTGVLYTSMLGGITNYFCDGENIVPSDTLPLAQQFPFSTVINTIVRLPDGTTKEYIQDCEHVMPGYLGSNAQFIPVAGDIQYHEIKMFKSAQNSQRTLLGWMVGGISSSGPQSGNGVVTKANNILYEVYREPLLSN
jgi:hypothetical protein